MLNLNELKSIKLKDEFDGEVIAVLHPYKQKENGALIEVYFTDGDLYNAVRFFTKDGKMLNHEFNKQTGVYKAWIDDEKYTSSFIENEFDSYRNPWIKLA